jgi:hypothetical protein
MKMIPGEGMPVYRRSHENGNLFIQFNVIFPPPNWAPAEKLALLEQVLPPRQPLPAFKSEDVDEYVLQNVDPTRQAGASSGGRDDMDEDDDQQGPSVQCAQQ